MAKKFNWRITAKKVFISALAVVLAGGVVVWQNNPYWLLVLPVLQGLSNYLKHK